MRVYDRIKQSLRHAQNAHEGRCRSLSGRTGTVLICVLAGFMVAVCALAGHEGDLRPQRSTNLIGLVRTQAQRNRNMAATLSKLRNQVDGLSLNQSTAKGLEAPLEQAAKQAGLGAVRGPGVRVTLADAPLEVKPYGVAEDLLVVHQQDIQAVINTLWQGGAEAITVQDVRIISTTGIKCVGNSVVLHGVPYAPPYVITAIGDPDRLSAALNHSQSISIYKQYVQAYQLGYSQSTLTEVQLPAYRGSIELKYAVPVR